MRDINYKTESAFAFLECLQDKFHRSFSLKEVNESISHGLNSRFKNVIREIIEFSRKSENLNSISILKNAIYQMKEEILETDGIINDTKEKINLIVQKADYLKSDSNTYSSWVIFF